MFQVPSSVFHVQRGTWNLKLGTVELPACLPNARDQSIGRHVSQTDAANAKFPINRPRPTAQPAAKPNADLLARRQNLLGVPLVGWFGQFQLVRIEPLHIAAESGFFRVC
jgi:hypothetical protein